MRSRRAEQRTRRRSTAALCPLDTALNLFCADIGSTSGGNFGWYGRLSSGADVRGTDMSALCTAVADQLNAGGTVALGFEAPMFVPLRSDPLELTKRRKGETSPNWIGGPGAAVLATALAQVPWMLRDIRSKLSVIGLATLSWDDFVARRANLFLWEAFVSGGAKGESHMHDAEIAVRAFEAALPDPSQRNTINELTVSSVLGAALLRTAWSTDVALLAQSCIVIRA